MENSAIVGIVATAIAVVSAGVSVYYNHLSQKNADFLLKIEIFRSKENHRAQLMRWAESGMDLLSELYVIFEFGLDAKQFTETRKRLLIELTSAIDKGRWLLPNNEQTAFEKSKPSAYQGSRQAALHYLFSAYELLVEANSGDVNLDLSKEVFDIKRRFASVIQEKLESRTFEKELSDITGGKRN